MDYSASFAISAAGMGFERSRADVSAMNLANMHVSAASPSELYRPLRVVAAPQGTRDLLFRNLVLQGLPETPVALVEPMETAPRKVLEPGHPHADARGTVSYPGVNLLHETVTGLTAQRAYEANVAAFNASKTMVLKALEIGRGT